VRVEQALRLPGEDHGDVVAAVLQHVDRLVVVGIYQAVLIHLKNRLASINKC
jgi:hypothetical protein